MEAKMRSQKHENSTADKIYLKRTEKKSSEETREKNTPTTSAIRLNEHQMIK